MHRPVAGEHPMARHDRRKRIVPQRLPDFARRPGLSQPLRNITVRKRRTRRNRTRNLIDAPVERLHPIHIEHDLAEIARLPTHQRHDRINRNLNLIRRHRLRSPRKPPPHTSPSRALIPVRQLRPNNPALTPSDPTNPNRRLKQRKTNRQRHTPLQHLPGPIRRSDKPVSPTKHSRGGCPWLSDSYSNSRTRRSTTTTR